MSVLLHCFAVSRICVFWNTIKNFEFFACGLAALSLTACMDVAEDTATSANSASALSFMTNAELLDTLPGATIGGISNRDMKTEWTQTYSSGGTSGTLTGTRAGKP